jgi:hypothetical protein
MERYPEIRRILSIAFSIETGLSDDAASAMLRRALQSSEWRRRFEAELIDAFSSSQTNWSELLFNDDYEVLEADTENQARAHAAALLWKLAFPHTPVPSM